MAPGSAADGGTVSDLPCSENAWVSLVIRDGTLLPVASDTTLRPGDDVLILAEPDEAAALENCFTAPASAPAPTDPPSKPT